MTTPTYQPLPAQDRAQWAHNDAQAFNRDPYATHLRRCEAGQCDLRGLYAEGQLVAQLALYTLQVQTGAGALPCGGLGGVVSPPQHRRRGYTARLLRETCEELRAQGVALCLLHPFKASFYGRFGWATVEERHFYSGAPELFAAFRATEGRYDPVQTAALADLQAIYGGALRGRFGPIARTPAWWQTSVLADPPRTTYGYLWRDDRGQARSYVIYQLEGGTGAQTLRCREAVALDPLARAHLFALLANHDSQCQRVVFRAPPDAPINALFPDPLDATVQPWFMLRLLDVAAALSAYRYPPDAVGHLTLAVADDWLAHNHATFEIEIAEGSAHVRRAPPGTAADLTCDVRVLAQLYARFVRPRSAAAFGLLDVQQRPALALLERMFAGLAPFCADSF